ncbi:MAG: translational GTPase TypA, partial [Bacteroidales bacterium]|nr:translational GTPase TypA [Bacteroidales bacterium]
GKEKMKQTIYPGEICAVLGLDNFDIGDTIADAENPEALPPIKVDEPTMSMLFTINNSPFFGREGKYVTSRHLRERLFKELEKNLALRIQETDSPDRLTVFGRGILHLSILIETMRREGFELQVGQPQVIIKEIDGQKCEPIEQLTVLVPEEFSSKVIDYVSRRKGDLTSIDTVGDRVHLNFMIPSRGIIGLRNQVLTATNGEAILSHRFIDFQPWKGEIPGRHCGALIAMETGQTYPYAIDKLQDRGSFFIEPGDEVYEGQVIGEHIRQDDLVVNVCKAKKLSNMRAAGSDEKIHIAPAIKLSLEEYMEFIANDEYLEVTPKSLRVRKIILSDLERKRAKQRAEAAASDEK